ncbi:hypothetical protein A9Y76_07850 [Ralstonia insidiosa]|uniref:Uncharacterized protein n=1 Tax=Ralstonia insidiosa TaxID=190721 RepID=A0A191ZWC9_9RALS|nr:hypothetical protein A9Y76_07850 [Ralstonia insidiosa]
MLRNGTGTAERQTKVLEKQGHQSIHKAPICLSDQLCGEPRALNEARRWSCDAKAMQKAINSALRKWHHRAT